MIGIRHLSNIHKSVFAEITIIKGVSASFVEAWGFIPSFCSFWQSANAATIPRQRRTLEIFILQCVTPQDYALWEPGWPLLLLLEGRGGGVHCWGELLGEGRRGVLGTPDHSLP